MNIEQLKKANKLRQKIEYLNERIDSIIAINSQIQSSGSTLGLNLEFVNVKNIGRTSFGVQMDEMKFIIGYLIEGWEKQKKILENEFEKL